MYYADGRGRQPNLGKHSLATKDRDEAIERLKALDLHMAIKLGLAKPEAAKPSAAISISDGWQAFIDYCGRSPVMGGVSPGTLKRYRAVRDKHTKFCAQARHRRMGRVRQGRAGEVRQLADQEVRRTGPSTSS